MMPLASWFLVSLWFYLGLTPTHYLQQTLIWYP